MISKKDLELIKSHLISVNTDDANTGEILRQYFAGINKQDVKPPRINPLAEPSNVNELVSDNLNYIDKGLAECASSLDTLTNQIIQINNVVSADLDNLEGLVSQAVDAVQDLTFAKSDEGTDFLWVSDSFNSSIFVDSSDVFVNTNRGEVLLLPQSYSDVTDFSVSLDTDDLIQQKALPGANLLINEFQTDQSGGNPIVIFDKSNSNSIEALNDEDITSWFEVEKMYVAKNQKLVQKGKAWVSDSSGQLVDIFEKTNGLDWEVEVVWPGRTEAVKQSLVDFLDPNKASNIDSTPDYKERVYGVNLNMTIKINSPRELSSLVLTPLIRPGYPDIQVNKIDVFVQGLNTPITIVENKSLTQSKSITNLISNDIAKKTSEMTDGVRFQIPTDRQVEKIEVSLYSPIKNEEIFAHPWIWVNIHRRSERSFIFTSVDHEDIPKRLPVYEKPPIIRADQKLDSAQSSVFLSPVVEVPAEGSVIDSEVKSGPLSGLTGAARYGLSTIRTAKLETAFLVGLADTLADRVLNIGGFSRDFTVTAQDTGFDVFKGARAAIAIRDLTLEQVVYKSQGTLLTRPRIFPAKVNTFGLFVEEEIPDSWPQAEWIEYYVKFDNKGEWIKITPLKGQDIDQSIMLDQPIQSFQLQVKFNGNEQDIYHSPILKHYAAKGLPV